MDEEKRALRIAVGKTLAGLSEEERSASDDAVRRRVQGSTVYQAARRIFCYYSQGREVSTRELIADAMGCGKTVALPVSGKDGEMYFCRYDGTLRPGLYGIMEPTTGERLVPQQDDLIIVPGLCYDRTGQRLGRGGGYYDRYLAAHKGITMGLCRDCLLQNALPTAWNDVPVVYVLTETATLVSKSGTSEEAPPRDA